MLPYVYQCELQLEPVVEEELTHFSSCLRRKIILELNVPQTCLIFVIFQWICFDTNCQVLNLLSLGCWLDFFSKKVTFPYGPRGLSQKRREEKRLHRENSNLVDFFCGSGYIHCFGLCRCRSCGY